MFLLVRVLSMDYEKLMLTYLKADKKRIAHTYGVKQRALELGKKYQADLEVLTISAYFHDITKLLTLKEHQKLINDDLLFQSLEPFMYHAYSAYQLAKQLNITNVKILEAIKYHLWGKIKMSLETKIICVSDFSEATRKHESAKLVYELSLKDLDLAYLKTLEETIDYLNKKGLKPHQEQIKTFNYYKEAYGTSKKDLSEY